MKTYPLAKKLMAVRKTMDKVRADLKLNKYELVVTVWLLKDAPWQGPRREIWSFPTLEKAKECKSVVKDMIDQQKRGGVTVIIGEEEEHFWKTLICTNDFEMFWEVGKTIQHTEKIIA